VRRDDCGFCPSWGIQRLAPGLASQFARKRTLLTAVFSSNAYHDGPDSMVGDGQRYQHALWLVLKRPCARGGCIKRV
jgi:hypothetical protein